MLSVELRKDLNNALRLIAEKLDLDITRRENAVNKYQAVSAWIDEDESNLSDYCPSVYPQGSFTLGTVVKPLNTEEYDIDLVCELDDFEGQPNEIKQIVGGRLNENGIYQPILEEKNRCWRLNYAGKFHLDILPARPSQSENVGDTAIEIPDKELREWCISDPQGYARWFKSCMAEQYETNLRILAQVESKSIEDVPEHLVKTTLQQAVQLLKRNRDIIFENDKTDKPVSIVLTTLAGHVYDNQAELFETLKSLVCDMPQYIEHKDDVAWVVNPVNPEENFADKWEKYPLRRVKFLGWLEDLESALDRFHQFNNIEDAKDLLEALFGESLARSVLHDIHDQKNTKSSARISVPAAVKINNPNKPWKK